VRTRDQRAAQLRLTSSAALALTLFAGAGCMQFDDGAQGELSLKTHVEDWRDEVIYQLLVDRFADGDPGNNYRVDPYAMGKWHGGDWKGVEDKLDYLAELGVTTLWISPAVKNVETDAGFDGYHGYWAQDLTQPNPHFGDIPALRRMVDAAHKKKIKVILDIVTNHMGQVFFYDINMNGEPDERVGGVGCDKSYPGDPDPTCKVSTSGITHVNEYDPDFDPRGIQSRTSLGEAGPAPIIFVYDAATNHVPPAPGVLGRAEAYNRKGRTYNYDDPDQLLHGDFPGGLKDLNTASCDVKQVMVDAYARWVELTDLDGFRIDTVKHVEQEFWRYFTQKVRQRLARKGKDNFLMFGEAFDGNDQLIGKFTKNDPMTALPPADQLTRENECVIDGKEITADQLDSVFYFSQYFAAIRRVFVDSGRTKEIESLWSGRPANFGAQPAAGGIGVSPQEALVNFLDNHDVGRFLYFSGDDAEGIEKLHNALLFIVAEQGIPCIYYGTEQQLAGGNDPSNREDLWKKGYDTSGPTFKWIQKLLGLRKSYPALRRGAQKIVWSTDHTGEEPDAGVFAFERVGGIAEDDYALLVFNTSGTRESATTDGSTLMKVSAPANATLVDLLHEGATVQVGGDGTLNIKLAPRSGALFVPQDKVNEK
jgi:alpha-amylase